MTSEESTTAVAPAPEPDAAGVEQDAVRADPAAPTEPGTETGTGTGPDAAADDDDDLDDLSDVEFMLEEIEDKIAPLA